MTSVIETAIVNAVSPLSAVVDKIYQPLRNSEIRLLRIGKAPDPGQTFKCTMYHAILNQQLDYLALSYTWGDLENLKTITVNDCQFVVSNNLFNALVALSSQPAQQKWLWIDAICINQSDISEKSLQIPRMTEIYSFAHTVLFYLALNDSDIEKLTNSMLQKVKDRKQPKRFQKNNESAFKPFKELEKADLPKFVSNYGKIITQPLFTRIWTLQEYVLSKRRVAFYETSTLPIASLATIAEGLWVYRSVFDFPEIQPLTLLDLDVILQQENLTLDYRSAEWRSKSLAEQLLRLLLATRSRETGVAHDAIYGLLGMTTVRPLPQVLIPDYTCPVETVFKNYAGYIIQNTGDLRILTSGFWDANDTKDHTWIPDLQNCSIIDYDPFSKNAAYVTKDHYLSVEGVRIGSVISVLERTEVIENGETLAYLRNFEKTILVPAARARRVPLTTIFREFLQQPFFKQRLPSSNAQDMDDFDHISKTNAEYKDTVKFLQIQNHFVLGTGEILAGELRAKPHPNHEAWGLKGSVGLHVLAPQKDGYALVGVINDFQKALNLEEDFYAQSWGGVKRITLL
jgi:hypothetical protein